jgi:CubicO group peptidase (beta-lactamase class C family)
MWGQLWQFKGRPEQARDLLLRGVVTAQAPEAEPGTKYVYSNAGYAVAGHMAEAVMKKPWEALLRERLFAPLGMRSAGFGAPGAARGAVDQPRGHGADGKPRDPGPGADNPVAIGPAGIVHCSLEDYAKYLALHIRGERDGGGAKLPKPETFKKLHDAPPGPGQKYAMGWIVVPNLPGAGRALSHDGSNTMWYVTAWVLPERDLAVAVICNQGGDGAAKACHEAAQQLMLEYLGREK